MKKWATWQEHGFFEQPQEFFDAVEANGFRDYPELGALRQVPQDSIWHPEGDVWTHTKLVCIEAERLARSYGLSKEETQAVLLSALCHDLGKATCTHFWKGRWCSPKHGPVGERSTRLLLQRINCPQETIDLVVPLVREHLSHANLKDPSERAVRRLLSRLQPAPFHLLKVLVEADLSGRPPLPKGLPSYWPKIEAVIQYLENKT
ncbi:HD domain-containing protein [Pseudobacteriovorax antillogorgiicola]|uniref:HD domain-containing protein n=1 Tax=Pseudobacteriovorax antillogorgiicola TaxID=1513793 RepID=A0A1Y6CSF0_9BACT|nr:HD domain-containing protein [Pseudobacteriovorax antillogorgiicola]TCS45437.1 HD domain-containing protein [Pseudobacteriovorax antillogorgiicola]SMF74497.1 HD domain-containing protein [Pseudobacteriovorax antillogorgiicola]